VHNQKLLLTQTEKITGFRVFSTNPLIEEVTGESKGKIGTVNTRTTRTYKISKEEVYKTELWVWE